MKLSQFTIFYEKYPQTGHHLVYNTLSRALVEIDNQCLEMLYSLGEREPSASAKQVLPKLMAQGIVVPTELDEAESYHQKFSMQRRNNYIHAIILTTLECPMRCIYCYQKDIRGARGAIANSSHRAPCDSTPAPQAFRKTNEKMSPETMEKTTFWLKDLADKAKCNRCHITFYGGEPLMNPTPISYIGSRMSEYCISKGISLCLSMVTGGVLLTPNIAEQLKRIGLKHLQITLDGDRDAHDKRRFLKDGSGTFLKIMENLRSLIKDFLITITCNVDKTNVYNAYRLVDILEKQGFAGKIKRLIFGPVSAPFELALSSNIACPETLERDLTKLTLYAAKRGFASDLRPRHFLCGMLLPLNFVIDPNGILYTCPAFLGREEYKVGSVNHLKESDIHMMPNNFDLPEECLRCAYVPICAGGCRFNALVEQGSLKAISCQKEKFSYSLEHLIKAHYALRKEGIVTGEW